MWAAALGTARAIIAATSAQAASNDQITAALEIGLEAAQEVAHRTHEQFKGYKPHRHEAVDEDVRKINSAIAVMKGSK